MTSKTRPAMVAALAAIAILRLSGVASATPTFTLGNNPQQPGEQNVLFGSSQTGTSINGTTNQSGTTVLFTSSQSLTTGGQGQAFLQPTNSSSLFTNFVFSVPNSTFGDLIFNPQIGGQPQGGGGTGNVSVTANDGTSSFSYALGNGQNFLTIVAGTGETLSSVSFTDSTGFNQLQQVRVSNISEPISKRGQPADWGGQANERFPASASA